MSTIISAEHPTIGTLFAAVDPDARYVTSKVSELRFAALLTPFKTAEEAKAALAVAGAEVAGGSNV